MEKPANIAIEAISMGAFGEPASCRVVSILVEISELTRLTFQLAAVHRLSH
jgi:hypothetical protein